MALTDSEKAWIKNGLHDEEDSNSFIGKFENSEVQKVAVKLTAHQVRKIHDTVQVLVPAPGPGKAVIPLRTIVKMKFNSNAYDNVGSFNDIRLKYTNGSGDKVAYLETQGFLDATSDQVRAIFLGDGSEDLVSLSNLTLVENAPIVIYGSSSNPANADADANGDSPVTFVCYYVTVDVDVNSES